MGNIDAEIISMGLMVKTKGLGYHTKTLWIIARPEVAKFFRLEKKIVLGVAIWKSKSKENIHPKENF